MEGSILEELATPEKCGGTPLHAWDQLQETWTAMLVVRGAMLAEWSNSGAGSGLLRKGEIEKELTKEKEAKRNGGMFSGVKRDNIVRRADGS